MKHEDARAEASPESPFTPALHELVRARLGSMPPSLLARPPALPARRPARRHMRFMAGTFGLAVAAAAAFVLVPRLGGGTRGAAALRYQASGFDVHDGDLQAAQAGAALHFSDGTRVAFGARAATRVVTVAATGARVRLLRGRAEVDVVPRPRGAWAFEAGPYLVTVRGTAFSLHWADAERRFEVALARGSVDVTGPGIAAPITLAPGERLVAGARPGEVQLIAAPRASAPEAAPLERPAVPAAAPQAPALRVAKRAAPAFRAPAPRTWIERIRGGEFQAVVKEAEAMGVARVLSTQPRDALVALADAARYVRRDELAQAALLAVRRRFRGTVAAQDAAFQLGRLAEREPGTLRAASHWYGKYLREAKQGAYEAEALSRQMRVVERLEGRGRARPLAERYLRAFPDGDYAATARAILGP